MENIILISIVAVVGFAAVKGHLRELRNIVQFNIQGSNPMVRLVPNISYTLLFILLLSITVGGMDAITTSLTTLK